MNEPDNFSVSAVQKKREQSATAPPKAPAPAAVMNPSSPVAKLETPAANEVKGGLPFDPLRLAVAILRKWKKLPLAGVAFALPIFAFAIFKFHTSYTTTIQLIRREVTTTIRESQFGEPFKPRQVTAGTIVSVMQSPKLLDKVARAAHPPMSGDALLSSLTIALERETDLIDVTPGIIR